jgi:hypothetical protein
MICAKCMQKALNLCDLIYSFIWFKPQSLTPLPNVLYSWTFPTPWSPLKTLVTLRIWPCFSYSLIHLSYSDKERALSGWLSQTIILKIGCRLPLGFLNTSSRNYGVITAPMNLRRGRGGHLISIPLNFVGQMKNDVQTNMKNKKFLLWSHSNWMSRWYNPNCKHEKLLELPSNTLKIHFCYSYN